MTASGRNRFLAIGGNRFFQGDQKGRLPKSSINSQVSKVFVEHKKIRKRGFSQITVGSHFIYFSNLGPLQIGGRMGEEVVARQLDNALQREGRWVQNSVRATSFLPNQVPRVKL